MAVREGEIELVAFRIDQEAMEAFRRISGDDNPVHLDPEFARRRGFAGPVVYGGLIVSQVSRLLGTRLPGHGCVWRAFSLRFRQPLHVGEDATVQGRVVHANEELGLFELALRVESGGRAIAEGEASAQLIAERELQNG